MREKKITLGKYVSREPEDSDVSYRYTWEDEVSSEPSYLQSSRMLSESLPDSELTPFRDNNISADNSSKQSGYVGETFKIGGGDQLL